MAQPTTRKGCARSRSLEVSNSQKSAHLFAPFRRAAECGVKLGLPLRHAPIFLPTGSTKDPCITPAMIDRLSEAPLVVGATYSFGKPSVNLAISEWNFAIISKFRSQLLQVDAELRKSRIFCLQPLHHFFLRFSRPWSSDNVNFLTIMNGFWLENLSVKHDPSARKLAANSCKKTSTPPSKLHGSQL